MVSKIQKWGNSQGIRIPKEALNQIHINIGDEVDIIVNDSEIVVKPARPVRKKYRLKDILPPAPSRSREENWGKVSGKENW